MKKHTKVICGAKNRQGEPCKRSPLAGKTRCRLHGGKTPVSQNAGKAHFNHKHGLYSGALSPEEQERWDSIPIDTLDDEIRMIRIWLARAGVLDYEIGQDSNSTKNLTGFELAEIRRTTDGMGERTDAISKRPDLWARKDRLLGRLAQLVKTRAELIAAAQAAGEGAEDTAQRVAFALRAMVEVETKQAPEDDDD